MNPGSRRGARYHPHVDRIVRAADVACDVIVSKRPGHLAELVRQIDGAVDAVFVLGGDGTVMEVVSALAGTRVPVGVLPGGTGNLIAGALGVPRGVARATRVLLRGQPRQYDLGRLGRGRYFAFAAGVGIDATMVMETSPGFKRRLGQLAYTLTAVRSALRRDVFHLVATIDGTEVRERATLAMVANFGTLFGNVVQFAPDVAPDDGRFTLCVFAPRGTADVLGITWRLLRRDFRPHPAMRFVPGTSIRLSCDPPHAVQADGDLVGTTPLEITVAPLAATFLVPARAG